MKKLFVFLFLLLCSCAASPQKDVKSNTLILDEYVGVKKSTLSKDVNSYSNSEFYIIGKIKRINLDSGYVYLEKCRKTKLEREVQNLPPGTRVPTEFRDRLLASRRNGGEGWFVNLVFDESDKEILTQIDNKCSKFKVKKHPVYIGLTDYNVAEGVKLIRAYPNITI